MPPSFPDLEDTTVLLNELKEISNKYSSRNESKLAAPESASEREGEEYNNCHSHTMNEFLSQTSEDSNLNQYWYSQKTIDVLCNAIRESCDVSGEKRVAFLSTPSLFFSLTEEERKNCALFDFDRSWSSCDGYHFYDYNESANIADSYKGQFDLVVIDPPFITQEVWQLYAKTAKLLLKPDASRVIATTVDENSDLMELLFQCKPASFRPSIPHLVYQYSVYVNFPSEILGRKNDELNY